MAEEEIKEDTNTETSQASGQVIGASGKKKKKNITLLKMYLATEISY